MKSPQVIRAIVGVLLLCTGAQGATRSAVVRWSASPSANVAGYRVYVRPVGSTIGVPRDAGLPAPAGDGSLSFVVSGLDTTASYGFAVTAVTPTAESPLSNEIVLAGTAPPATTTTSTAPPRPTTTTTSAPSSTSTSTSTSSTTSTTLGPACVADADCVDTDACTNNERCEAGHCTLEPVVCPDTGACSEATCDPVAGCRVDPLPDGSPCEGSDPCIPGTCNAGVCTAPAPAAHGRGPDTHVLAVSRFVLRRGRAGHRLLAQASFAVEGTIDPTAGGGLLQLRDADGGILYEADVPGATWRANRSRRAFRYVASGTRRAPETAHGLTKIVLRIRGTIADVSVSGSSPDLAVIAEQPALGMVLALGDRCVRDPALDCRVSDADTACQ
jgi:fibronectin type III domain protein